ncbi:MAG: YceI family protein [Candidatus Zixiibacteriota bacterium]
MMFKNVLMVVALVAVAAAPSQAEQWKVDPVHSGVHFKVSHMVIAKVNGEFKEFDATLDFDGEDVSTASVQATAKTASISTDNERRDGHLKSPDFFDAEKYPEITFKSKKVIKGEGNKFQLVGDLTMRGVTKEVTFNCEFNGTVDFGQGIKAGFTATTTINRQDFGVAWSKTLDSGGLVAGNDVEITLEFEFDKVA